MRIDIVNTGDGYEVDLDSRGEPGGDGPIMAALLALCDCALYELDEPKNFERVDHVLRCLAAKELGHT